MFSFFDPPAQVAPAAPQVLSAVSQSNGVLVSWLEPDNGGSPITAYNIYRGTSSGTESLLQTVTNDPLHKQTKYLDTTAIATSSNYFYHVTAVNHFSNADHESSFCEEVSVIQAVTAGNACAFPYLTMNSGATNAAEATNAQKIQYVNIGEPFTNCTDNSLTFVMKVPTLDAGVIAGGPATGQAVLPPNTEYQILWNVNDTNGNPKTIYVSVDSNCPIGNSKLPEYTYGRRDPGATGTFDQGECSAQPGNPAITCPAISGSFSSDGTIIIKLNVSTPLSFSANTGAADATEGAAFIWDGHAAGTQLKSVSGSITLFAGCAAGFLETLSSSSGGAYTRIGNIACSDLIPIAQLTTVPAPPNGNTGNAPLTVSFDASASHEPAGACGTINSYTLNFGDGTISTQTCSGTCPGGAQMFTHQYTTPGNYPATLTVKNTVGQVSTNLAQVVVTVNSAAAPALTGLASRMNHGSRGPFDVTWSPTGSPGIECRSSTADGAGNYTMVFQFANPIASVAQATVTNGTGSVSSSAISITNNKEYLVHLTGVTNAQFISVGLVNAKDSTNAIGNLFGTMGVLIGDVNATGLVDGNDVSAVQAKTRQSPPAANFRLDVNATGLIDGNDVSVTQGKTRTSLPHLTETITLPASYNCLRNDSFHPLPLPFIFHSYRM